MTYLGFLHLLCNDWRSTFLLHYETNIWFSSWKVQATRKMCVTSLGEVCLGHFTSSLRSWRVHQLLPHSSRCLPSYWRVDPSTGLVLYHDYTINNWFWRLLPDWLETQAKPFFKPTSADYTRYKAKHQGSEEAIEDHEHDSINQMYFNFYRIAGMWSIRVPILCKVGNLTCMKLTC